METFQDEEEGGMKSGSSDSGKVGLDQIVQMLKAKIPREKHSVLDELREEFKAGALSRVALIRQLQVICGKDVILQIVSSQPMSSDIQSARPVAAESSKPLAEASSFAVKVPVQHDAQSVRQIHMFHEQTLQMVKLQSVLVAQLVNMQQQAQAQLQQLHNKQRQGLLELRAKQKLNLDKQLAQLAQQQRQLMQQLIKKHQEQLLTAGSLDGPFVIEEQQREAGELRSQFDEKQRQIQEVSAAQDQDALVAFHTQSQEQVQSFLDSSLQSQEQTIRSMVQQHRLQQHQLLQAQSSQLSSVFHQQARRSGNNGTSSGKESSPPPSISDPQPSSADESPVPTD